MTKNIDRNYLEINSLKDLNETHHPSKEYSIIKLDPPNFHINKFFYKNVGKNHQWRDRLVWTENQWIKYTTDKKASTYILKAKKDLAGYFELIYHEDKNEVEIAYLGLLQEYHNKKLGSYLLSSAIKKSFLAKPKRVFLHTCSLDHKNALNNYLSRGMNVYKKENVTI